MILELFYGYLFFPKYMYVLTTYTHHFIYLIFEYILICKTNHSFLFVDYFIQEFPTFLLACKRYWGIKNWLNDVLISFSFIFLRFFYFIVISYKYKHIIQESYVYNTMFIAIGKIQTKWCIDLLQKNIIRIPFGIGEIKRTFRSTVISKDSIPFSEISFHSSGWMKIFEYGVSKYIQENYDTTDSEMIGTSAGALVACSLCCDIPIDIIYNEIIETRNKSSNPFSMCKNAKQSIKKFLPKNCVELIKNRLTIVCCKLTANGFVRKAYQNFKTYTEVVKYLNATVHLPILDGILPEDGLYDGMFIDSHPQKQESCLKITWDKKCYCGCTKQNNSIFPDVQIPVHWLLIPPNEYILSLLYEHGYYCAKKYFLKNSNEDDILNNQIILELNQKIESNNVNCIIYFIRGSLLFISCLVASHIASF